MAPTLTTALSHPVVVVKIYSSEEAFANGSIPLRIVECVSTHEELQKASRTAPKIRKRDRNFVAYFDSEGNRLLEAEAIQLFIDHQNAVITAYRTQLQLPTPW